MYLYLSSDEEALEHMLEAVASCVVNSKPLTKHTLGAPEEVIDYLDLT